MLYRDVVEKAKKQKRIGFGNVIFEDCKTWLRGDQINLWTYWQGYQLTDIDKKGVDILLVGQDWGCPKRNPEVCERINKIQNGVPDVSYMTNASPTDKRLAEMFKAFGKEIDITSNTPGMRLFFTNYSLGYRRGSETGGMTKKIMSQDSELFTDLVEAIHPRIIICLGKITYEMVIGHPIKRFCEKLKGGIPFREAYPANAEIIVYGVAHPGARGLYNIGGSEEVMKQSWIKIAEDMY